MTPVQHTVTIRGKAASYRRLRPEATGRVLASLAPAVRASSEVMFRGLAGMRGRRPAWLNHANDFGLVDIDFRGNEEARLHITAPRYGDIEESPYNDPQLKMFGDGLDRLPSPTDTAFDTFADVLSDIRANQEDSDRFDSTLLRRVGKLPLQQKSGVSELEIEGDRIADHEGTINRSIVETADRWRTTTPAPRKVRVCGELHMIEFARQVFSVKLADGAKVRGVWLGDSIEPLRVLGGEAVVFSGTAVFRPSGMVLRVETDRIEHATDADAFFSEMPKASPRTVRLDQEIAAQQTRGGIAAVFGKWPGEESAEELERLLREVG